MISESITQQSFEAYRDTKLPERVSDPCATSQLRCSKRAKLLEEVKSHGSPSSIPMPTLLIIPPLPTKTIPPSLDSLASDICRDEPKIFKGFADASHRVAVLEISSLGGRRRATCLFLGDFDFVGIVGLAWAAGDRYAAACVRALAFQLVKEPWDNLDVPWAEQLEFNAKHYLGQDHWVQGRPGSYIDPRENSPPPGHNFYFQIEPLTNIRLSHPEPRFHSPESARLF